MMTYEVIDTATGEVVYTHDDIKWANSFALGRNREQMEPERYVVTLTYKLKEV